MPSGVGGDHMGRGRGGGLSLSLSINKGPAGPRALDVSFDLAIRWYPAPLPLQEEGQRKLAQSEGLNTFSLITQCKNI